jgi:hypothetical protein
MMTLVIILIEEDKVSKKNQSKTQQSPSRQLPWPWLIVAGALLLVIGGGLLLWQPTSPAPPAAAPEVSPEVSGGPKLKVDQTVIDEGDVKLDTPVRTTFRLSNVGDQPLIILGQPQVELIEGC